LHPDPNGGKPFYNITALQRLHNGALGQLNERLKVTEARLDKIGVDRNLLPYYKSSEAI
jgi:hypothetical protein